MQYINKQKRQKEQDKSTASNSAPSQLSQPEQHCFAALRSAEDTAEAFKRNSEAELAALKAKHAEEIATALNEKETAFLQDLQAEKAAHASTLEELRMEEKIKYDRLRADLERALEAKRHQEILVSLYGDNELMSKNHPSRW